jgi:cadmium resistance protein CadD (predicted permease)
MGSPHSSGEEDVVQLPSFTVLAERLHYLVGALFIVIGVLALWRGTLQIERLDTHIEGFSARLVAIILIALGIWILNSGPFGWFGP